MASLSERFWSKVEKTDACWLWTAAQNGHGYGVIGRGRRDEGLAYAHVLSYEWANGPVPDGLEIDHTCTTPACVNPEHLEAVTHAENMRRMGRRRAGTHCRQGHLRDAANTYVRRGKCYCRVCNRDSHRRAT